MSKVDRAFVWWLIASGFIIIAFIAGILHMSLVAIVAGGMSIVCSAMIIILVIRKC